jgi:hypothetical protein
MLMYHNLISCVTVQLNENKNKRVALIPLAEQLTLLSVADAVCGAPKRRFKPYQPKATKDANATDVRKARKEQLKREEAIG